MQSKTELTNIVKPAKAENEKIIIKLDQINNVFIETPVSTKGTTLTTFKQYLEQHQRETINSINNLIFSGYSEAVPEIETEIEYNININEILKNRDIIEYLNSIIDQIELLTVDSYYYYPNLFLSDIDTVDEAAYNLKFNWFQQCQELIKNQLEYFNIYLSDFITNLDPPALEEIDGINNAFILLPDGTADLTETAINVILNNTDNDNYFYECLIYDIQEEYENALYAEIINQLEQQVQHYNNITNNNIKPDYQEILPC